MFSNVKSLHLSFVATGVPAIILKKYEERTNTETLKLRIPKKMEPTDDLNQNQQVHLQHTKTQLAN